MTRDEAVSALQQSGIPVEPDRSLGRRAIVVAAARRRRDVAAELLRAGADPPDLVDAAAPPPRAKEKPSPDQSRVSSTSSIHVVPRNLWVRNSTRTLT